jgi:hypothetical protein
MPESKSEKKTPSNLNEWARLRGELGRHIREPAGRVAFVVYFFSVVMVLGGLGWIIPLCRFALLGDARAVSELPSAWSTFFLALLAGAIADIVLGDESTVDNLTMPVATKGFKMFTLGLSLLGVPLAFAGIQRAPVAWAYIASISGMAISLFLWWVLNADRARWRDEMPEPISATGGSTAVDLKGTTEGLTV